MFYPKSLVVFIIVFLLAQNSIAQIVGNNTLGSAPAGEVKSDMLKDGALSGSVNLFNGTYNTSYPLGSVSEPGGLSYSLNMSYQSVVSAGALTPLTSGIPYGDGWNLDIPRITVSSEDFDSYSKLDLDQIYNNPIAPHYAEYTGDNCALAKEEGQLYWFAPMLNIPGVASGRMILKSATQGKWIFVLNEFEEYIEAKFTGSSWVVLLPNGIQYEFGPMITHRSANGQRIDKPCTDAVGGQGINRKYALPQSEVVSWYCLSITDRNSVGKINFAYNTYGRFDYNQALTQIPEFWNHISESLLFTDGWNGQAVNPYVPFTDIYLDKVFSSTEQLQLEYEVQDFGGDGVHLLYDGQPEVEAMDDMYMRKKVYQQGGLNNDFTGWKRYRHGKADDEYEQYPVSPTNPFVTILSGQQGVMNRHFIPANHELAFDHGFLESGRIQFEEANIPGEIYLLESNVKAEANLHLLDINIATGGSKDQFYQEVPNYLNHNGPTVEDYNKHHRQSIHSTFSKPIKWLADPNSNSGNTTIREFFTMPSNPATYGGFNIQIGPGISDTDFSIDLSETINNNGNVTTPLVELTYFKQYNVQDVADMALYPSSPMPQNFGVGLPAYNLCGLYGAFQDLAHCDADPLTTPYGFWWNPPTSGQGNWPNQPTLNAFNFMDDDKPKNEDTYLKDVSLYRYSKTPLMLKRVVKKKLEFLSDPENNQTPLDEFEVNSILEFDYTIETADRIASFMDLTDRTAPPTTDDFGGEQRNIILLSKIRQVPIDLVNPSPAQLAIQPTYTFEYAEISNFDNFYLDINTLFPGGNHKVYNGKSKFFVLSKTFNPFGGETNIEYFDKNGNAFGNVSTNMQEEFPDQLINPESTGYNVLKEIKVAYQFSVLVQSIYKNTDTQNYQERYEYTNRRVKLDGPLYDYTNENYRAINSSTGYAETTKYMEHLEGGILKSSKQVTQFYTDEENFHFFGKPKITESYDENDQLVAKTEATYEAILAFEGAHRRRFQNQNQSDYDDYKLFDNANTSDVRPLPDEFNTFEEYINALNLWEINYIGSVDPEEHEDWLLLKPSPPPAPDTYDPTFDCELSGYNYWSDPGASPCTQIDHPFLTALLAYRDAYLQWLSQKPSTYNYTPPTPQLSLFHGMLGGSGSKYYEMPFGKQIDSDPNHPENALYLNAYFIKKTKDESWNYESACNSGSNLFTKTTKEYEYFDADLAGFSDSPGYDKLFGPNCLDVDGSENNRPFGGLFNEPSFQLYSVKTTNSDFPNDYQLEETFYVFDLANDTLYQTLLNPDSDCVILEDRRMDSNKQRLLWKMRNLDNYRTLPFESRVTIVEAGEQPIVRSTFYEYRTDYEDFIPVFLEPVEVELNDLTACQEPDNDIPAGVFGTGGTNYGDWFFNAQGQKCIYGHYSGVSPGGTFGCQDEEIPFIWCECPPEPDGDGTGGILVPTQMPTPPTALVGYEPGYEFNIYDPYDGPGERPGYVLKGKIYPSAVYTRLDQPNDPLNDEVIKPDIGKNLAFIWPTTMDILKTEEILSRNQLGLPVQMEDARGVISEYDYGNPQRVVYQFCEDGMLQEYHMYLESIVGYPKKYTVGVGLPGAQEINYEYFPNGNIESITDPNGITVTHTYDGFNRLISQSRNGDLIAEYDYSNWSNEIQFDDQKRAGENFRKTKSYITASNFFETVEYVDVTGQPLGVTRSANGDIGNTVVMSNPIYNGLGQTVVENKPYFGLTPNRSFVGALNDISEFKYEIAPKSRVLKTSKFGNAITSAQVQQNAFCALTATELIALQSAAGQSPNADGSIFMSTETTDEDNKSVTQVTNSRGQLVSQFANNNQFATIYFYDVLGNVTKVVNPENQTSQYFYNHLGLLYLKINPDQSATKYAYDQTGLLIAEYNPTGYLLVYEYDEFGRMLGQYKVTPKAMSNLSNHPIFNNQGLFWLDGAGMGVYDSLLPTAQSNPEKTWRYDDYSEDVLDLFNDVGDAFIQMSFENAQGKVAETSAFDQFGQEIERVLYSYTNDGFVKWEMHKSNFNGVRNGTNGQEVRIDYAEYNLQGGVLVKNVDVQNDQELDVSYTYAYDGYGRLTDIASDFDLDQNNHPAVSYAYDDINDLVTKKTYRSTFAECYDVQVDEINYTYDHQFRMTYKDSKFFDYGLYYDGNLPPTFTQNASTNYNGNINSTTAQFSFPGVLSPPTLFNNGIVYNYAYDDINRLTQADLGYMVGINPGIFGDGAYWYDKVGNLTTMRRGVLSESGQTQIQTQSYNYQNGSNRLLSINECLGGGSSVFNFGTCSGGTAINFTLDQGGNLRSDSKKSIIGIDYHRQNLSYRITKLHTGRDRQSIDYLYDAQDARIYKRVGRTRGTAEELEFYLRDVTGDNLGILDITADDWTWYVNGVARESKFKGWGFPESEGPPVNPGDPGGGGDGPIKSVSARNTYAGAAERQIFQQRDPLLYASILEFKQGDTIDFPVTLQLIEIEGDTLQQLISQAQLANLNQNYTLIDELQFHDPRDRFLAYEEDASPVVLSLMEMMDLPDGWEDPAPPLPGDPFDTPMGIPGSHLNPIKSFYIYDHLGNTRLVYMPDRCAGSFIYTKIEYAADYYPYGKVLREYVGDVREKFLTTQHERDLETDFDYRGARYMDAEYGRFLSVDPLASDYASWSTYNYVLGNPVRFVDPDGRAPDDIIYRSLQEDGSYKEFARVKSEIDQTFDLNVNLNDLGINVNKPIELDGREAISNLEAFGNPNDKWRIQAVSLDVSFEAAVKFGAQVQLSVVGMVGGPDKGEWAITAQANVLGGLEASGTVTGSILSAPPGRDLALNDLRGFEDGIQGSAMGVAGAFFEGQDLSLQNPFAGYGSLRSPIKSNVIYRGASVGYSIGPSEVVGSISAFVGVSNFLYKSKNRK